MDIWAFTGSGRMRMWQVRVEQFTHVGRHRWTGCGRERKERQDPELAMRKFKTRLSLRSRCRLSDECGGTAMMHVFAHISWEKERRHVLLRRITASGRARTEERPLACQREGDDGYWGNLFLPSCSLSWLCNLPVCKIE